MIKLSIKIFSIGSIATLATSLTVSALNENVPQIERPPEKHSIKICNAKITESGRTASFRFSYIVRFSTQKDGSVENLKKVLWKGQESLLNTDSIIPCIKTWKLDPEKVYLVSLSLGTSNGPNKIQISNTTDNKTLTIEL